MTSYINSNYFNLLFKKMLAIKKTKNLKGCLCKKMGKINQLSKLKFWLAEVPGVFS